MGGGAEIIMKHTVTEVIWNTKHYQSTFHKLHMWNLLSKIVSIISILYLHVKIATNPLTFWLYGKQLIHSFVPSLILNLIFPSKRHVGSWEHLKILFSYPGKESHSLHEECMIEFPNSHLFKCMCFTVYGQNKKR